MLSKSTEIKSPLFIKNLVYLILRSPFPFIKFFKKFLPSLNKFSKNNPVLRLLGLLLFIWHLSVVIILRKHLFLKIPDPLQWSFPSSTSEQFLSFSQISAYLQSKFKRSTSHNAICGRMFFCNKCSGYILSPSIFSLLLNVN